MKEVSMIPRPRPERLPMPALVSMYVYAKRVFKCLRVQHLNDGLPFFAERWRWEGIV